MDPGSGLHVVAEGVAGRVRIHTIRKAPVVREVPAVCEGGVDRELAVVAVVCGVFAEPAVHEMPVGRTGNAPRQEKRTIRTVISPSRSATGP